MYDIFHIIVSTLSLIIGMLGMIIIIIGTFRAAWSYGCNECQYHMREIRGMLGAHLILALDFLIGKDIIETFLLRDDVLSNQQAMTLITVVIVRIAMSYFLEKELENIRQEEVSESTAKKSWFKRKK